ncbi:MAG: transglutaminase-like domain-containing protein [Promethearchaeota archaeon]
MEDLTIFLRPTEFLDHDKKIVRETAFEITKGLNDEVEKAKKLFYFVRDEIKYNMYTYMPKFKSNLKASVTLRRGYGFCMSKAVLLSALGRAVRIPARIHMVDIINHRISQKIIDLMGTNIFFCHGYSELFIRGKWIKLTPAFDQSTAEKAGYLPNAEFDGEHDAMFSKYDEQGNLLIEYINDHGIFTDVPIEEIRRIFAEEYKTLYVKYQI